MDDELLIETYKRLNSTYKVAKELNLSRFKVRKRLKELNVLHNQSESAKIRGIPDNLKGPKKEETKKKLSELAKNRTGNKNPFYGKTHNKKTREILSSKAKQRTANRNPNYKHGEYQRRPRDFKIAEFTKLRNFVFNRDDYTCKYCKRMGGHLHAHHLIPYWVEPNAFLDPLNLITVCTECHFKEAHKCNWIKFDLTFIDERLLKKYKLHRERLNELTGNKT